MPTPTRKRSSRARPSNTNAARAEKLALALHQSLHRAQVGPSAVAQRITFAQEAAAALSALLASTAAEIDTISSLSTNPTRGEVARLTEIHRRMGTYEPLRTFHARVSDLHGHATGGPSYRSPTRLEPLITDTAHCPKTFLVRAFRNLGSLFGASFGCNPRRNQFWVDRPAITLRVPPEETSQPGPIDIHFPAHRIFFTFGQFNWEALPSSRYKRTRPMLGTPIAGGQIRAIPEVRIWPLTPVPFYSTRDTPSVLHNQETGEIHDRLFRCSNSPVLESSSLTTHLPTRLPIFSSWHPHILGGKPCLGEISVSFNNALACFDYAAAVDLLDAIIRTYNPVSPYQYLRHYAPESVVGYIPGHLSTPPPPSPERACCRCSRQHSGSNSPRVVDGRLCGHCADAHIRTCEWCAQAHDMLSNTASPLAPGLISAPSASHPSGFRTHYRVYSEGNRNGYRVFCEPCLSRNWSPGTRLHLMNLEGTRQAITVASPLPAVPTPPTPAPVPMPDPSAVDPPLFASLSPAPTRPLRPRQRDLHVWTATFDTAAPTHSGESA
jgi:hypothetical protein